MESAKSNEDIDKAAKKLSEEIQCMTNYKNLYHEVQVFICSFLIIT